VQSSKSTVTNAVIILRNRILCFDVIRDMIQFPYNNEYYAPFRQCNSRFVRVEDVDGNLHLMLTHIVYAVESEGTWTINWSILKNLLEMRQQSFLLSATRRTIIVTSSTLVVWLTYSIAIRIIEGPQTVKKDRIHCKFHDCE
jgi:hypothetical protein